MTVAGMAVSMLAGGGMVLEEPHPFRKSQGLAALFKLALWKIDFGQHQGEEHGRLLPRIVSRQRQLPKLVDSVKEAVDKRCIKKGGRIPSKHPLVAPKGKNGPKQKPTSRSLTRESSREYSSASLEKKILVGLDRTGNLADSATYASLLRRCCNAKALSRGKKVHADIIKSGLEQERFLVNLLVQMYGKCGALEDASAMFAKLKARNVFSWTIMIAAYAQHGQNKQAVQLLKQMQLEGVVPNKYTFVTLLSACANQAVLTEGKLMHARIVNTPFQWDVVVGNALITMYAKCGSLEDARRLFDKMPERDVISWNAMIAAYAQHGQGKEALQLFRQMQLEDVMPDKVTFVSILDACANQTALGQGKLAHAYIVHDGLESDVVVGNALVNMYGKCGSLEDARRMLHKMPVRNVVSWTAMIAAYSQHGHGKEAIQLFHQMQLEGMIPNRATFVSILSACASQPDLAEGKRMHAHIMTSGFHSDVVLGNALVNMYSKCGNLDDAQRMFDNMPQRNVISWTVMIAAYAHHGQRKEALQLFQQMQLEGIKPDKITFVTILDAFASQAALAEGKWMHAHIVDSGFESDVVVATGLINMYGKCHSLQDARRMFDKMPERNLISWNAMITAYAQHGQREAALELYQQMQLEGLIPDRITYVSIIDACTSQAALAEGRAMHTRILNCGFESDVVVSNALVNMYGKCGNLKTARRLFDKIRERDVFSWNAMIGAYAQHGEGMEALHLFQQMQLQGEIPNKVTFVNILSACCHAGLVDEGCQWYVSMSRDHGIVPTVEHYNCMINLFGIAGQLDEGEDLINSMPFHPTPTSWMTLLYACRKHSDVARGMRAAEHVFALDPDNPAPYVLLSNIYLAAGRWDDAATLRRMMENRSLKKQPGCSSIEVKNSVHDFFVGDEWHPQKEEIYADLQSLGEQMEEGGYVSGTNLVLHDWGGRGEETHALPSQ